MKFAVATVGQARRHEFWKNSLLPEHFVQFVGTNEQAAQLRSQDLQ
jgi:hypothetical protein